MCAVLLRRERRAHLLATRISSGLPYRAVGLARRARHQCVGWLVRSLRCHRSLERLEHERARDLSGLVTAHAIRDRKEHPALANLEAPDAVSKVAADQVGNHESILICCANETLIGLPERGEASHRLPSGDENLIDSMSRRVSTSWGMTCNRRNACVSMSSLTMSAS